MAAAAGEWLETTTVLMAEFGASPNLGDNDGWTALMAASKRGFLKVATQLLQNGAQPNQKARDGQHALMVAAYNGRSCIVELLLTHGADANVKSHLTNAHGGITALQRSAARGHEWCVRFLLRSLHSRSDGESLQSANSETKLDPATDIAASMEHAIRNGHSAVAAHIR